MTSNFLLFTSIAGLAAFAYGLWAWQAKRAYFLAAVGLHTLGLGLELGQPVVRFGFAPALSATACLLAWVYALELRYVPRMQSAYRREAAVLACLAAAAIVAAIVWPGALLGAHAQAYENHHGVWRWHLVLGLASYGAVAAAAVHAWLLTRTEQRLRSAAVGGLHHAPQASDDANITLPLLQLERLMFRFVQLGFILVSATLVLGGAMGQQGFVLRWDHKTVLACVAWMALFVLLVGRQGWGWRGAYAARWVYGAGASLLLAYVGSRFVLEVLLRR